jgi:hypothetical protein
MTKFVHIVQVHPVELSEPNLHKVELEREFETKEEAERWAELYNDNEKIFGNEDKAVYYGCVNDATGELV